MIEAIVRCDQIGVLVDGMPAANDLRLSNAVPTNWYLYEDWETAALSDTHREKPEITAFLRDWKHMLQKPPERTRLKLIGNHGPFGQTR